MSKIKTLLKHLIEKNQSEINAWFHVQYKNEQPCFYSSVDIRHSGTKLTPVDTNLFPAGFNNIGELGKQKAIIKIKEFFKDHYNDIKRIILIPEAHTRNLFYLDNIAILQELITAAGKEVILGDLYNAENSELVSNNGSKLDLYPLIKDNKILKTKNDFIPDLIILNNDLTNGIPALLEQIEQPIIPSPMLGWHTRRKSKHFESYNQIITEFCNHFNFDPFFISTAFHTCGTVNFKDKHGLECVALGVEKLMHKLRLKYKEYEIDEKPYVFIKADNGTYGMGIMTVSSGEEVYEMNKKLRNKMDIIKGGTINSEVIIQEGIRTIDKIEDSVAEPMIYLIGGEPISCFFRVNSLRDEYGNLNAQGMQFDRNICEEEGLQKESKNNEICDFTIVGLIAKLASLAAAKEEKYYINN